MLPDAVKRRHERLVVGRRSRANAKSTAAYLANSGRDVRRGPLQGLRYPESVEPGDIVAKLVGSYEAELHPVFESWIDVGFEHAIDVGSAEGYYAAGLAHAAPSSTVHAFDIDPVARENCQALARANGIEAQLNIGEFCSPDILSQYPDEGVVLLVDCEGYEATLMDPAAAPKLRRWRALVELHDFVVPGIADVIAERFSSTHAVEIIEERPRDPDGYPELQFLDRADRSKLVDEFRPAPMSWARLTPLATSR